MMGKEIIKVKVFRFDPSQDEKPYYQTYEIPFEEGMSVMNALDYIYSSIDSTLACYDHAGCYLGICGQCIGIVNGKLQLMCQTRVEGDLTIQPRHKNKVIKDLVEKKEGEV